MDFTTKQWLIGIILIVIIAILIDGFRRMRRARQDSLHMSLNVKNRPAADNNKKPYGSEFPNGGARVSDKSINKERIDKVKSQYDFGRDLSDTHGKPNKTKLKDTEQSDNKDQWLDDGEGDEEYYANKWDAEYELPDELEYEVDSDLEDALNHSGKASNSIVDEATQVIAEVREDDEVLMSATLNVDKAEVVGKEDEAGKPAETKVYAEPKQVPLNLEESVPVLMETVEEGEEDVVTAEGDDFQDDGLASPVAIRSVGKHLRPAIEPTIDDLSGSEDEDSLNTRSANKPRYQSKYFSSESKKEPPPSKASITEVLVINVKAVKDHEFQGSDLLQQVLENDLRYGAMNIFHRHADEDGEGPVLFSMANMLMPGIFDLKTIDSFSTAGVSLFLTLPVVDSNNMAAFELMVKTAKVLAASLGGNLKDEHRSVMTAQTIEHYRERIRDFSRRQQLEKNK
ncbi:MAG: cell division protein ZipA [Enterobacterales bacterium]|jgi:cell division protein ZipA